MASSPPVNVPAALKTAIKAARAAGKLMRDNWHTSKHVNHVDHHDIKLELDVRCQKTIEKILLKAFPESSVLGEEGSRGNPGAAHRWVVDPIDGTVNYFYSMPHAAVSIALQKAVERRASSVDGKASPALDRRPSTFDTVLGVIYDPFTDELWTATRGGKTRLNGRAVRCSNRSRVNDSLVAIGFSKSAENLRKSLPHLCRLARRAKKIRIMGSAALELAYVASGRLDVYIERTINLWDIAAGGLMVECSGGEMFLLPLRDGRLRMVADNGRLRKKLGLNSLLK